jgi:hypothetical protein
MEVKKDLQGVVATVGRATWADCPRDCSIYKSSLALMVGCFEGFSKDSHSHNTYQTIPATPEKTQRNKNTSHLTVKPQAF